MKFERGGQFKLGRCMIYLSADILTAYSDGALRGLGCVVVCLEYTFERFDLLKREVKAKKIRDYFSLYLGW